MAKLLFRPFSILAGLLAGLISKKTFELLWGKIDEKKPPQPEDREASAPKLVLALALEGAIFRVVKGLVDRAARQGFAGLTGSWPGKKRDESA